MKLKQILENIKDYELVGNPDSVAVSHAAWDTRLLRRGGLFVLRVGKSFNPITKIEEIKKKSQVLIAHKTYKSEILEHKQENETNVYIFVEDLDHVSQYLVLAFTTDLDKLRFVGITGTNGKTTVTKILKQIFDHNKQKSAAIGTIAYEWGRNSFEAFMTTPDKENFSTLCAHMLEDGVENVFMEISSHALVLGRVDMLSLDAAAFTNLSPEHLDFHKTMPEYAKAKTKIHDLLKESGFAVVNADDKYSIKSADYSDRRCLSFGVKNDADYKVSSFRLNDDSIEFIYQYDEHKDYIKTNLVGYFNVENCLTAVALANQLGLSHAQIAKALKKLKAPCGRMEKVIDKVYVDYAHTSDALDKCLASIKELGYENIVTVFGCGGNRDKSKRKLMGEVADSYCTRIIITDDNPRDEEPEEIASQIAAGIVNAEYTVIHDRKSAIEEGLALIAGMENSVLLIAGKGHESYQLSKGIKKHFSDQAVVKELCH